VLSCEHGGRRVPREFKRSFVPPESVLGSHRGHDAGTSELGRHLAKGLGAPLVHHDVTRLLVDANRSRENPERWSKWSLALTPEERARAEREHWAPHRDAVEVAVAERARGGRVLHVSVHSFTPRRNGVVREVDIGFLYDPSRMLERTVVARWLRALEEHEPRLRLRRNRPYKGTDDGLTTALRQRFADARYAGIELEVSQRFPRAMTPAGQRRWRRLQDSLEESLAAALRSFDGLRH